MQLVNMNIEKKLELLEEENTRLKEIIKRLSLLMDSIKVLNTSLRTEVILKNIVDCAAQVLDADCGTIMLLDKDTRELEVVASTGKSKNLQARVKIGKGISGKVAETGRSILVTDIESDPRFKQKNNDKRYRTKSFVSVPLKVRGETIGVLNISDKKSREAFQEDHLTILIALLSQASFVIEYSRLYEAIRKYTKNWEPF